MARKWIGTETLGEVVNSIDLFGAEVPLPNSSWKVVDFAPGDGATYRLIVEVGPGKFVQVVKSPHEGLASVRNAVDVEVAKLARQGRL